MSGIEVRGFGKLYFLFKKRGWPNPLEYTLKGEITAGELREELEISKDNVEAVFINRVICPLSTPINEGDRVAFVPPGIPTIHRFNLGFYGAKEDEEDLSKGGKK